MKAIELNMPGDICKKLENLASHDHQPVNVNVFTLRKLEEFARAFEDFRELEQRAQRGSRENFQAHWARHPATLSHPASNAKTISANSED